MKLFHRIGHIKIVGCVVLLLGTAQVSLAQTVEKNAEGERIVKYDDGTWRYIEGSDSLLLQNVNASGKRIKERVRADSIPQPIIYDYRLFQRYISAAVKYESRMLDRVDDSSGEVHQLEDQIIASEAAYNISETARLRAELVLLELRRQDEQRILSHSRSLIKRVLKVGKSEKYFRLAKISIPEFNPSNKEADRPDVPEEEITPINQFIPVDDEFYTMDGAESAPTPEEPSTEPTDTTSALVETKSSSSSEDIESEKKASDQLDTINQETEHLTESDQSDVKEEKDIVNTSDEQPKIDDIKVEVPTTIAQKEEEVADVADTVSSSTEQDEQKLAAQVEDAVDDQNTILLQESRKDTLVEDDLSGVALQESVPDAEPDSLGQLDEEADVSAENSSAPAVRPTRPAPTFTASMEDRWFSPQLTTAPAYECEFAYNGIDEITNKQKRELREEIFFTHTDERLKPYLKDRDYVTCGGYLTSISGGFRYLTLVIRIASRNAVREYGSVRSGSLLNLKLLNGETVSLFCSADYQGAQDPKSGDTLYKVRYPIDYQKEKILTKSGIDKVRIVWSSGYEDYEVYNVNFFSNQLDCLNGK